MYRFANPAGWAGAVSCLVIAFLSLSFTNTTQGIAGQESRVFLILIFTISAIAVVGVLMSKFHPMSAAALRFMSGVLFWGNLNFSLNPLVLIPAVLLIFSGLFAGNQDASSITSDSVFKKQSQ